MSDTITFGGIEFRFYPVGDGVNLEYNKTSCVAITMSLLKEISKFYGTDEINIDNWGKSNGCETCDYGATYHFTINVRSATRGI